MTRSVARGEPHTHILVRATECHLVPYHYSSAPPRSQQWGIDPILIVSYAGRKLPVKWTLLVSNLPINNTANASHFREVARNPLPVHGLRTGTQESRIGQLCATWCHMNARAVLAS